MARARLPSPEATVEAGHSAKLDVINGLRGIAICGVVWQHLFSLYFKPGSGHYLFGDAGAPYFFLSYGWIGVQLFFLLSGFVLFLPIAERRAALATRRDWLTFYRRRAQRLLPLYYIAALLCLVLNQDAPVQETKFLLELGAIAGALFTFSPHGFEPYFNPPLWSLGVEIWFSILFPVIALALRRLGAVRLLALAMALAWISRYLGNVLPAEGPLGVQPLTIGLPASLEIFIAGMVLAELFAARPRGLPLVRRPALVFLAGVLLVAIAVSLQQLSAADLAVPIVFPDILTLGFALIAAALLSMPAGALKALFANRPIQLLGMMCFSLYVWHEPLLRHVFKADMAPLDGLARTLPAYLGLLLTVGALSYRYIEFGRVADWRSLFLIERKRAVVAAPAPVAAVADQTATGASL
ncbi:MAG TPA: acyltransferase [Stellaceae bacterium]|nr:acyltransferase [Stellaceae bacterium]